MSISEQLTLRAVSFDAPYLIQILRNDGEVLITVAAPAGQVPVDRFNMWIGYGVDANGIETLPDWSVKVSSHNIDRIWQQYVGLAYRRAYNTLLQQVE